MNNYIKSLKERTAKFRNSAFVSFFVRHKKGLSIVILIAFFVFIIGYIYIHPSVITQIEKIGLGRGLLLFLFYFCVVLTNFGIMYATIKICKKDLPLKSGLLLTMYSSVINFFGPLQSGPGVRAVYLKTKVGLRIRDYTYAMLFYYFVFAALNASMLFINRVPWLTALGVILGIIIIAIGTRRLHLTNITKYIFIIFGLTVAQIVLMVLIYGTELGTVDPSAHYTLFQIMSYTGSANLSLFVSLTPGGIGIREAFLIFSESLHHIQLSSIVAAGVLDRAFYILFLIILFVISSALHLKETFVRK